MGKRGINKKPDNLLEPLQTNISWSGKPSKGRDKRFKIGRVELIQNIQSFLTKMDESSDESRMPPTIEVDDENQDDSFEEIDLP